VADYSRRLRGAAALELVEVPIGRGARAARMRPGRRRRKGAHPGAAWRHASMRWPWMNVARRFTTVAVQRMAGTAAPGGEPLSFIIGGPDGPGCGGAGRARSCAGRSQRSPFRTHWCGSCSPSSLYRPRRCWPAIPIIEPRERQRPPDRHPGNIPPALVARLGPPRRPRAAVAARRAPPCRGGRCERGGARRRIGCGVRAAPGSRKGAPVWRAVALPGASTATLRRCSVPIPRW